MPLTYASYLKLDELLALQQPVSDGPEHDEMLFIVIHQVYELWFKEMLHELDYLKGLLERRDDMRAQHTLKRVLTILKVVVAQIDVLETMTPLEFLTFRERLESGSGFQSFQFRELEFLLGMRSSKALLRYPEGSSARKRLERRLAEPSLWDAFLHYLVAKAPPGLLTYYPEDHIMVVNLNDWMPPGIDLSLERTLFEPGQLTLQFASGSYDLADFLRSPAGEDD